MRPSYRTLCIILPIDLSQLLSFGKAGLEYAKKVTDWVVSSLPEEFDRFPEGLLFEFNEVTLTAPIIRPGKVICIAGNYPAPNKLEKPEFPTIFLKPSGGVVGNNQAVILPAIAENVAYEVERMYIDASIAQLMAVQDVTGDHNPIEQLSGREFEVFVLLARGVSVNQIAEIPAPQSQHRRHAPLQHQAEAGGIESGGTDTDRRAPRPDRSLEIAPAPPPSAAGQEALVMRKVLGQEGFAAFENEITEGLCRRRQRLRQVVDDVPAAHHRQPLALRCGDQLVIELESDACAATAAPRPCAAITACLIASLLDICITTRG